ncbi:PA14 domain-containing protein [Maribacter sp. HTCC2170]|uniref:PA14 domain-containing protein n=1 Tax=Maribacter sp. (strain HTCC2170 / KCCM 42371) TaxID=313603 RepID=UPI00006BD433|nr:PA14 domain-containing protein [Maribacter sp. HTCC2170]EAR02678.1 putative large, multifunctional secreted protein [Maribacter sp. HTCC2170]
MKKTKLFQLVIILIITVGTISCERTIDHDRPIENWVFRSVIDKQPRMLTVALHKDLYACYNLQSGNLYKIWKGGVNYDGAVYTTAHGIQPTSFGFPYMQDDSLETQWAIKSDKTLEIPKINYLGYTLIKGQVALDFELKSQAGKSIKIREIPEVGLKDSTIGMIRKFQILEGSSMEMVPILTYNLDKEKVQNETITGSTRNEVSDQLEITKNTTIKTYFNQPPKDWKPPVIDYLGLISDGMQLAEQSDCKACHLINENLVGPAYDSIATRYPFDWASVDLLADKIKLGGTGVWGDLLMTAHPDLSKADTQKMAYYILSLDGEAEPSTRSVDLALDTPDIPIELDVTDRTIEDQYLKKEGVAISFYLQDDSGNLYEELTKSTLPIYNTVAPAIHMPTSGILGEINENFYMEFNGFIKSETQVEKTFRLISDDGSVLKLNGKEAIDNKGYHAPQAVNAQIRLNKGFNDFLLQFHQGGGGYGLSLQWSDDGENFTVVPDSVFYHDASAFRKLTPYVPKTASKTPGDQMSLDAVHPSFDMYQAKPADFHPRIGGIDFIDKDKMVICTWDETGAVYILKNYNTNDPESIEVKQIATGLAEPLGIKYVDGELFVLQKQELTKLIDTNGDEIIDEYQKVCDSWNVTSHYHEFAFGLVYKEGSFYATLATDLGSEFKDVEHRGKVVRIRKDGSEIEFIAEGFRTPNGIAEGPDGALYVADNQGNWIPTSKIVRVEKGKFYGFKHADWERVKDYEEDPPLVWLPHGEISNSPSQPAILNIGPYKNQMIHGDVTHGGIKRVFIDEVDGVKQGAAFRFIQGLDAGINRTIWGPDGNLYAGGVGSGGNWRHEGRLWYALHRFNYNQKSTFEMLAVRAKRNGMEIEFTEPVASDTQLGVENFDAQQYYYVATDQYGGPKMGEEDLKVVSVNLSNDRKKVFLEIDGIEEKKVVYIHIKKPFKSENGQSLWSTETWYTMTKKPGDDLGL